jgi:hypothetical protein
MLRPGVTGSHKAGMHRPSIAIASPALADANNGNWQTVRRWQRLLAARYRVRIIRAGPDTPAIASRVPGNVGMLGGDDGGVFPPGDAGALAGLLRCRRAAQDDPAHDLPAHLRAQCDGRACLFAPAREHQALPDLIDELLHTP